MDGYYTLARDTTIRLIRAETGEGLMKTVEQMRQQYNVINDTVRRIRDRGRANMDQAFVTAKANQRMSQWVISAVTTFSVFCMIGLGVLAVKFGLAASANTRLTCIVIVEVEFQGNATVMGVLADSVSQVIDLMPDDIEPAPPFGTRVKVDYLTGIGKIGSRFALILDVDRVLSTDELLGAVASLDATRKTIDAADVISKGDCGGLPETDNLVRS